MTKIEQREAKPLILSVQIRSFFITCISTPMKSSINSLVIFLRIGILEFNR